MDVKIVSFENARVFGGGAEHCREYYVSDRITFGTSTIEPGDTGPVDWGHKDATEVWYVVEGHIRLRTPKSDYNEEAFYELKKGDILVVPQNVPHEVTNIGDTTAVMSWSLAPGMNGDCEPPAE